MATKSNSIIVSASKEEIWSILSDFDQIFNWAENVDHSCFYSEQEIELETPRRVQQGPKVFLEPVPSGKEPVECSYQMEVLLKVFKKVPTG